MLYNNNNGNNNKMIKNGDDDMMILFQDEDRVLSYRTTSCPTVSYMKGHPTCDDEHFAALKIQTIRWT